MQCETFIYSCIANKGYFRQATINVRHKKQTFRLRHTWLAVVINCMA